jgi:hypothetical protein
MLSGDCTPRLANSKEAKQDNMKDHVQVNSLIINVRAFKTSYELLNEVDKVLNGTTDNTL